MTAFLPLMLGPTGNMLSMALNVRSAIAQQQQKKTEWEAYKQSHPEIRILETLLDRLDTINAKLDALAAERTRTPRVNLRLPELPTMPSLTPTAPEAPSAPRVPQQPQPQEAMSLKQDDAAPLDTHRDRTPPVAAPDVGKDARSGHAATAPSLDLLRALPDPIKIDLAQTYKAGTIQEMARIYKALDIKSTEPPPSLYEGLDDDQITRAREEWQRALKRSYVQPLTETQASKLLASSEEYLQRTNIDLTPYAQSVQRQKEVTPTTAAEDQTRWQAFERSQQQSAEALAAISELRQMQSQILQSLTRIEQVLAPLAQRQRQQRLYDMIPKRFDDIPLNANLGQ